MLIIAILLPIANALNFSKPAIYALITFIGKSAKSLQLMKQNKEAAPKGLVPDRNYYCIVISDINIGLNPLFGVKRFEVFQRPAP